MKFLERARGLVFVFLLFFAAAFAFAQTATVQRRTKLHKSASSSSPAIETLTAGTKITLISDQAQSGYYHVQISEGETGWVWGKNIDIPADGGTPADTGGTQGATGGGFDAGCAFPFDAIKLKHPIIDDSCSVDGSKRGGGTLAAGKLAENHAKSDFCATGTPVDISYDNLLQLQQARQDVHDAELPDATARHDQLTNVITVNGQVIGEGTLVRLVINVIEAHPSDTQTRPSQKTYGESVNCYRPSDEENDIHIVLGRQTGADECTSVTAEMSPHYRPAAWTPDNINSVGEHPVRITGPLFYDSSHEVCQPGKRTAPKRASLWEIHPVYAIEVCTLTNLDACKTAPATDWQPLAQFVQ
jgi:hypothetical protein